MVELNAGIDIDRILFWESILFCSFHKPILFISVALIDEFSLLQNRGPAKPWYEIEGSDDEEGSLLSVVKKRSRSGSHSSSSRVNNSNVSTRHLASSLSSEETASEGQDEDGEEEQEIEAQNGENRENEGSFPKAHFL